jgi:MbtH protein
MNVVEADTTIYKVVEGDNTIYKVATNREGQFSIWPVDQEIPVIWEEVVKKGLKQECLDYIIGIWQERKEKETERQALEEKMEEEAKRRAFEEKRRRQMKISL